MVFPGFVSSVAQSDHGVEEAAETGHSSGQTLDDFQNNMGNDRASFGDGTRDSQTQMRRTFGRTKTVTAPGHDVLQWSRNLSIKRARQSARQGLRVKVRFSTRIKRDGKLVRKKKWYGGVISQVSKAGSKIRIKYDDGTTEVAKFPDKDVVVDEAFNGHHSCAADLFTPPGTMSDEDNSGVKEGSVAMEEAQPRQTENKTGEETVVLTTEPLTTSERVSNPFVNANQVNQKEGTDITTSNEKKPLQSTRPQLTTVEEDTAVAQEEQPDGAKHRDDESKKKRGRPPKTTIQENTESTPFTTTLPSIILPSTTGYTGERRPPMPPDAISFGKTLALHASTDSVSRTQIDQMKTDDVADEKPRLSDEDKSSHTPKSLSIRIPNLTVKEPANVSIAVVDDSSQQAKAVTAVCMKQTEPLPPKRIHISLPKQSISKESHLPSPAQGAQPQSREHSATPVPAGAEVQGGITVTSPLLLARSKKAKRKRAETTPGSKSPNPRSKSPKPDQSIEAKLSSEASAPELSTIEKIEEADAKGIADGKSFTNRSRNNKIDSRSARRASQQGNETKQDSGHEAGTKKKKKRRREQDVVDSDKEENQQPAWVQCDKCRKWRIIPRDVVGSLRETWFCSDNLWDPKRANCEAPQQKDKQFRKRKRRQQGLVEKVPAGCTRADSNEANSEASNERESSVSRSNEDIEEQFAKKSKRASPSEELHQSDSSVNNDRLKINKKIQLTGKKPRTHHVATEHPETHEDTLELKPRRGRPRRNVGKEAVPPTASNNEAPGEGAENVAWVQCEKCEKWRKLPPHISADELPDVWYCSMNSWNPDSASCNAPEDKAEAGVTDIFSNEATKLSYRNLIFGNVGRKFNRPISERTRAAESIFAAVSDDTDAPPAVAYANSSAFISRSKLNHVDEGEDFSFLDLISRSHLCEELRSFVETQKGRCTFDNMTEEVKESLKDLILLSLGTRTLTGEEVTNHIHNRSWQNIPLGWAAAKPFCSLNTISSTMCELVREGVLECMKKITDGNPVHFVLTYRRNRFCTRAALWEDSQESESSGKCRKVGKLTKPWKSPPQCRE